MSDDQKAKPTNFGFDMDFSDLSTVKPITRVPSKPKAKEKKRNPRPKQNTKQNLQNKPAVLRDREEMADKVAKSLGFASREETLPKLKKRRRTHHDEPVDQLSIRGPVRVLNGFITYCEENNLSYWEAMDQLLKSSHQK